MGSRWFSAFFLAVVIIVLGGLLYLGYFISSLVQPASGDSSFVSISIAKGDGVHDISQALYSNGLISNRWNFEAYVWLRRWGSDLKAGEYTFPKNITMRDLAQVLASGKSASNEISITFIEGWTAADMGNYLEERGIVSADDFIAATKRQSNVASLATLADKPVSASLEGYLFPDTYRIYRGALADDIVTKAVQNFEAHLTDNERAEIKRRGRTIFEVLAMASIIEKEVRHPEDLPLVADIFYRRLGAGIALESDATLNYVLKHKDATLSAEDLKSTSPYNSYRFRGLPPGPISNPGAAALTAAIFPKANTNWFFLSGADGRTYYARTFAEHIKNKQLYLK